MPRRPQRIDDGDLNREIAVTTRIPARIYNQLIDEATERDRVFIGNEVARLILEAANIREVFGRGAVSASQLMTRTFAKAMSLSADTQDPAAYRSFVKHLLRDLWRHWPNRDYEARRSILEDVIEIADVDASQVPAPIMKELTSQEPQP